MERVLRFGGVFLRSEDPQRLAQWYRENLGLDIEESWCGAVLPGAPAGSPLDVPGIWSAFPADTDYFGDRRNQVMVNFVVEDRDRMLEQLRANGCTVDEKVEQNEFGRFGWVTDPDGNRLELWQPPEGGADA